MSDETNTDQGVTGVGLLVAAYVDELAADQNLEALKQAKKSGDFYYDDAAVIRSDAKGKVHIKETGDMSAGKGAGVGALIGGVVGLLAGPVGVAAAAGAAIGAIAAHHDAGFGKDSLKEIGSALPPGSSALVVTTSKEFVEAVRKEAPVDARLSFASDIAREINERLTARQDILMAMVLTEDGVAATEVVSSPSGLAVFGIAASDEGVVAFAGVVTEEGAAMVEAAATPIEDDAEDEEEDDTE